jgi:phage-related protein/predicted XRE-type DNA-binding protein
MADKPLRWVGSSLADLRAFPEDARQHAGYQLGRVQQGLLPDDWKPMPSVGAGVVEIRIHTDREHRVFYVAKFDEAIYVLHASEKRTRQTRHADIELARRRPGGSAAGADSTRVGDFMATKVRRSSGNAFHDLGFPAEEAENLKLRTDLMIELSKVIKSRRLTQARAAKLFGVTQPRVSDLVRGKIDRFSVDTLVAMLGHAGVHVELTAKRRGAHSDGTYRPQLADWCARGRRSRSRRNRRFTAAGWARVEALGRPGHLAIEALGIERLMNQNVSTLRELHDSIGKARIPGDDDRAIRGVETISQRRDDRRVMDDGRGHPHVLVLHDQATR